MRRRDFIAGLGMTAMGTQVARAQQSGIKRTDLQQHDLGIAGREVVQVRVDFSP